MSQTITITRAEYDALIAAQETLADIKAVANYRAAPGEGVPLDIMKRLLSGESPLKVWRTHRGWSQSELAQRSGTNRIQIGDIEDRGKNGSVATLQKLATALNVTIDDIIPVK